MTIYLRIAKTTFCIGLIFIIPVQFFFSQPDETSRHAWMISKMAEKYHYQPKLVNDEFATDVFEHFIKNLDPLKVYFTKEEFEDLRLKSKQIDDDILAQKRSFLDEVNVLFSKKINEIDQLIANTQIQQFDFQKVAFYSFQENKAFSTQKEFKELWINRLKVQMLLIHYQKFEVAEDKIAPSKSELQSLLETVKLREGCRIKTRRSGKNGLQGFVDEAYLKAITKTLDPHSEYFTAQEESKFESLLSKETRSFGLEFYKNDDGEIEIYGIAPGGPAWKSNEVNEQDILVKVIGLNKEINLECFSTEELENFLLNPDMDDAEFFLRKKNGDEVTVKLEKEVLEVLDNIIESFVLNGEKKFGYIYLPSFYTNQGPYLSYSSGCANDVAKELLQLKKEGIEGLILDLRNNGGGSMLEAILLSGIFIDFGAISIAHSRDEIPQTLKDVNRGTIFQKPLIILVNDFSASASELFAASMQDHNRALIVGSTTYGKSTSQQVLPIDYFLFEDMERPEVDVEAYIKLTTGTFYRVTGETHQGKGVVPEIKLPSLYEQLGETESAEPNVLSFEKLEKKTYYTPAAKLPIDALKESSAKRVQENAEFNFIIRKSVTLAKRRKDLIIPLKIAEFESYYFEKEEEFSNEKEQTDFVVEKPSYIADMSDATDLEIKLDEDLADEIASDPYIIEAFFILRDILHLEPNK